MPCSTPPWRWSGRRGCKWCRWRRWPNVPGSAGPSSTSTSPTATSSWLPRIGGKRRNCTRTSHRRSPRRAASRRCTGPSFGARCGRPSREARSSPPSGRGRVEPRHPSGATVERSRDGSGLRRGGGPPVRAGAQTFHLCHRRPVGRARCRPRAMAHRSDRGEQRDPRGDVPRHGGRRVFRGLCAWSRP